MTARSIGFAHSLLALNDNASPTPAAFDATPLPAASATRRSEIVVLSLQLPGQQHLGLWLRYVGGVSGTTGLAECRVWASVADELPADYMDTSWHLISGNDGVITGSQKYANANPAVMGSMLMQPLKFQTPLAAAAAVMPPVFTFRLPPCKWVYVEACEIGDAAHPGTLGIGLSLG
jgi:hypothetical protein